MGRLPHNTYTGREWWEATKSARAPCGLRAYPGTSDTRHILLAAALGDTGNAILQPRRRAASAVTQSLSRLTGVRSLGTRGGHPLHGATALKQGYRFGVAKDFVFFCANFDAHILSQSSKFWTNFDTLSEAPLTANLAKISFHRA